MSERPSLDEIFNSTADPQERPSLDQIFSESESGVTQDSLPQEQLSPMPEKQVGFFGSIPESAYKAGQRNIVGNIFERPAAAIRSGLMGRGYVQGAMNPGNVPTFQDEILKAYYQRTPNFPGKTALGNIPSAVGLAADTVTNPADMALALAGKLPGVQNAIKGIRGTSPAQKFEQWMSKERNIMASRPQIMTNKWLVDKARSVKTVVDDTLAGFRSQYKSILGKNEGKIVKGLEGIPEEVLSEFDVGNKPTIGKLWEVRNTLLSDIADSAWDRPNYYKKIKPRQEDLKNAVAKIKAVVMNNLDNESRNAILELDPKFTEVMNTGRKLIRTVYEPQSDTYKVKPLINMFRDPENAGAKEAFQRFQKFNGGLRQVEKDIGKYIGRQKTKQVAKKVAGAAAIAAAAGIATKGLRR